MANISAIKLPSGNTYNIVDKTSGYTTNTGTITKVQTTAGAHTTINVSSGAATFNVPTKTSHLTNDSGFITNAGVTGVKGNSESTYRTGQVNLTAANIGAAAASHTHSANDLNGGYINIHPENSPIIIPFMHNDIAYLLKRGGSASITYDGTTQTVDLSNCFDGSGSYWTVSGNISTIVIELTLHKQFTWTNTIYVDFGSASWRAKSIKIEAMNTNYSGDTWATKTNVTNYSTGHITCAGAHTPSGASNAGGGFNKLRFTFSDFNSISTSGGSFRIAQIGVYNYGSMGLRETYMSRGADDYVFRDITPNSNNTYNLGSSSNKWANIYATTFSGNLTGNVTGNVSGSASSVAWTGVTGKPSSTGNSTTSISIANHGTGTVIGVQSTTTTASKVTVGSHSTDYGVKSAGSASTWTFEEKTIPNVTSAGTASSWTFEEKTIPNVTAAGSGSASLTFAMDTTDTKKLKITFSHTHTAPTIGTAIKVQSKSGGSNGTAPTLGTAIKVQSKSGGANSTAPTLGSKIPTVSATDVTVPIKNSSASTFVTGTTHTITDNGHTHSI